MPNKCFYALKLVCVDFEGYIAKPENLHFCCVVSLTKIKRSIDDYAL